MRRVSATSKSSKLEERGQENCIELFEDMKLNDCDIGIINSLFISPERVSDIIRRGPETLSSYFPKDLQGNCFRKPILVITLKNCEQIKRDWLAWSRCKKYIFCYPCRLLRKLPESKRCVLSLPSGYLIDKGWRNLCNRIPEHESSNNHKHCYLEWRALESR